MTNSEGKEECWCRCWAWEVGGRQVRCYEKLKAEKHLGRMKQMRTGRVEREERKVKGKKIGRK